MDASLNLVDLLSQVSSSVPHAAPFQPIFGALKILLQRAQKLSDDKRKLATITSQAAQLSLRLNDLIGEDVDHLGDKLVGNLDEISVILRSITAEIRRLDGKSGLSKFFKAKSTTDKVTRLYDQLHGVISDCHIVLGIDGAVKLGQTHNVVMKAYDRISDTHDRVSDIQSQLRTLVQRTTQKDDLDFEVFTRKDLQLIPGEIKKRSIWANIERMVRVSTYDALLHKSTVVLVKKFEASERSLAKQVSQQFFTLRLVSASPQAFEQELRLCGRTWEPFILQPFGRSSMSEDFFLIIYHSPSVTARIHLPVLLTRCVESEDNLVIPIVFSLPKLIRQWVSDIPVYPCNDQGEVARNGLFDDWIERIVIDTKRLNHSLEALPFYEGELWNMEKINVSTTVAAELLMRYVCYWLHFRYSGTTLEKVALVACKVAWYDPCALPLRNKDLSSWSLHDLQIMLHDTGWHGVGNKPSLVIHDSEVGLSNHWEWFIGSDRLEFWSNYWDDELGCERREYVIWRTDVNRGWHSLYCNCGTNAHGNVRRWTFHLRIVWLNTPFDGLEFRSRDYFERMEIGDWEVVTPGAGPLLQKAMAAEVDLKHI